MISHLTPEQLNSSRKFRSFADTHIAPRADEFDRAELISDDVIQTLANAGFLAGPIPKEWGGMDMDMLTYGLLTEELGRTCQSIRNLVAVEDMVAHAIWKWGTAEQRRRWLPAISSGQVVAAFALTEPDVGSDASAVRATVIADRSDLILRGTKKWISFAQIASLYLVFAQYEGLHSAFLVERDTPGLTIKPMEGLLGLRGSMLAELSFDECRIPATNIVGSPGMGLTFVASSALDLGRYSTAWGCVGLAQACLEAAVDYANRRTQHGRVIRDHQLVQHMLADMMTDTIAARLLCHHAGVSKLGGHPDAINHTLIAKYRSSQIANRIAGDAVQIHGAQGVGPGTVIQRLYRDAKVMEIIEGTTQIQQVILGQASSQMVWRARHQVVDRRATDHV